MHNSYERMTFYKTPRGRSKKMRKYAHIDLTKEFEFRKEQREKLKQEKLERLYESHDRKALSIKDIIAVDTAAQVAGEGELEDHKELTEDQLVAIEK